jgi:hypothetical protein
MPACDRHRLQSSFPAVCLKPPTERTAYATRSEDKSSSTTRTKYRVVCRAERCVFIAILNRSKPYQFCIKRKTTF